MEELDATDEIDSDLQTAKRDFRQMEAIYYKEGFREGADVGKQSRAQEGFNDGYRNGVDHGMKRGRILGQLNAMLCWLQSMHTTTATGETAKSTEPFTSELQALLIEAEEAEGAEGVEEAGSSVFEAMEERLQAVKARFVRMYKA